MAEERKVLIVSSIPPRRTPEDDWNDLAELTWATQRKYCERYGYTFHPDISNVYRKLRSPERGDVNQGYAAPLRVFVRYPLLQYFLDPDACRFEWDIVAWVDADVLITNFDVPLLKFTNEHPAEWKGGPPQAVGDIITAWDDNALHPTVIIARATALTLDLMWHCNNAGWTMFGRHDWGDNLALRFGTATPPYRDLIWYHSAKSLCAQHPGAYSDHPQRVRRLYEWTPESLSLHLSALPMPDRIKLAKEYIERLKLL